MEKRSKEIVLLALAVVLVVAASLTLLRKQAPAPAKVQAKPTTTTAPGAPKKQPVAPAKPQLPTPQALLGHSPGNSPNRNPFAAPPSVAAATPTPRAGSPANMNRPMPGPRPAVATSASMPMMSPLFSAPSATAALAPIDPAATAKKADENVLRLMGVIRSKNTLAVLRKGEARYFVSKGDRIEGNYVVANIGPGSVTLKSKDGNQMVLPLGGGR